MDGSGELLRGLIGGWELRLDEEKGKRIEEEEEEEEEGNEMKENSRGIWGFN